MTIVVFFINFIMLTKVFVPFRFSHIVTSVTISFLTTLPCFTTEHVIITGLFLQYSFIFLQAALVPMNGQQRHVETRTLNFGE